MNFFKRFIGHLRTVHKHRAMVRKLCFKCGLYWQGLTHDLSKYSPVEFWNGVRFYTGKKSPHVGEREKYGYSRAWLNHKGRNKHHAEYWQDIRPNGKTETIIMPERYFVEMICDRIAASMVYNGASYNDSAPLHYYLTHKDENQFHPETQEKLEFWLDYVEDRGSDCAFKKLKELLIKSRRNSK